MIGCEWARALEVTSGLKPSVMGSVGSSFEQLMNKIASRVNAKFLIGKIKINVLPLYNSTHTSLSTVAFLQ